MGTDNPKTRSGFAEEHQTAWVGAPLGSLPCADAIGLIVREAGITEEMPNMFEQSLAHIRSARSDSIHKGPSAFGFEDPDA